MIIVTLCSIVTMALVVRYVFRSINKQVSTNVSEFQTKLQIVCDNLVGDVLLQRTQAEQSVNAMLANLNDMRAAASVELSAQTKEMEQAVEDQKAQIVQEYERMDQHFRESVSADVTLHVLTTAYALVASGKTPNTEQGAALLRAVVAHRKEGSPLLDAPIDISEAAKALN